MQAPPYDQDDVERALDEFQNSATPYALLTALPDEPWLQELVITGSSGHRYGVVLEETAAGFDALAYYRDPPLMNDPSTQTPHGFSSEHAIARAKERQHA